MLRILTALAIIQFSLTARAEEPDWKSIMTGVDGVVTYCDSSTKQKYGERICRDLAGAVALAFDGSGLTVAHNGYVLTGSASPEGLPAETVTKPLYGAEGMTHPLVMAIVIKGTDGQNPGIYARVQAGIAYRAAVDQGSGLPGKAGMLVFAERAVVGDGPKKPLPGALAKALAGQATELIKDIRGGIGEAAPQSD